MLPHVSFCLPVFIPNKVIHPQTWNASLPVRLRRVYFPCRLVIQIFIHGKTLWIIPIRTSMLNNGVLRRGDGGVRCDFLGMCESWVCLRNLSSLTTKRSWLDESVGKWKRRSVGAVYCKQSAVVTVRWGAAWGQVIDKTCVSQHQLWKVTKDYSSTLNTVFSTHFHFVLITSTSLCFKKIYCTFYYTEQLLSDTLSTVSW